MNINWIANITEGDTRTVEFETGGHVIYAVIQDGKFLEISYAAPSENVQRRTTMDKLPAELATVLDNMAGEPI